MLVNLKIIQFFNEGRSTLSLQQLGQHEQHYFALPESSDIHRYMKQGHPHALATEDFLHCLEGILCLSQQIQPPKARLTLPFVDPQYIYLSIQYLCKSILYSTLIYHDLQMMAYAQ